MGVVSGRRPASTISPVTDIRHHVGFISAESKDTVTQQEPSRQVLEECVDAYVAMDFGGRVYDWNQAASDMFGWTREEAGGQLLTELVGVSPEQREWVLRDMRQYVESGRSPVVGGVTEHRMRRKSGAELPTEVAVTAIGAGPQLTFHVFIRDMTDVSEMRAVQRGTDAMFKAVFDNAPTGVAVVGLDGSFLRVNSALCRITGYHEGDLTQLTFQDITYPDDLDKDLQEAARLMHGEIASYEMEKRYYAKDGHLIWVHLSGSMMYADDGQPLYFIAHIKDISARKRDEEMLRTAATRDTLTGVLNRGRFEEELARYRALARRHEYCDDAAVLMIDLDGLKKVNDQRGHTAGDEYIKTVAQVISRRLRLSDTFARIGGDEFAALLPHTSASQAQHLAQTLADLVSTTCLGSISIGVAMLSSGNLDHALERADKAMYQAKLRGGGGAYGPI